MKILGSAVKQGFGIKVEVSSNFMSFGKLFPDSMPTFLNVYTIAFHYEKLFSKKIQFHHISNRRLLDLGISLKSVSEILLTLTSAPGQGI